MAKDSQSPPQNDQPDKHRHSQGQDAAASPRLSNLRNSATDQVRVSMHGEGEEPTTFIALDSLALIKAEIRIICFLDLVHNFFMIAALIYSLARVAAELDHLMKADYHYIHLNGYELPEFCLWGVILAVLLHILMLAAGMVIVNQIRCGTYPYTVTFNLDTASRNYLFVNGILVTFGFMCNVCLLIYFPYPDFTMGVLYLFSNCFRTVALGALRSLIAFLSNSSNDYMVSRCVSQVRQIPTIITTSPSSESKVAK